jgi:asparagine synthase (glutamine-hydrolysing)
LGAIAAVFSKSQIDAPRLVAKMLSAMRHRAQDAAAVAWENTLESAESPARLGASSPKQNAAIGYGFTRILPNDNPQPIRAGRVWFGLDGRIVADGKLVGGEEAARILQAKLTPKEFPSIRRHTDGAYAICCCTDDRLLVTRDPLGLKPLYFGRRDDLTAVASDRKALWTIGIAETTTFPPGGCLNISASESTVDSSKSQLDAAQASPRARASEDELIQLLTESVKIQTTGLGAVAAGFSGGLDSTVVAKIAKGEGVDLLLVAVGVGRTAEMNQAESTARTLELPIVAREFSKNEVTECVDDVLWLIEEPSLMKVSIAMAMRWIAQVASEKGRPVVILGQGSDELFGGYKRFATILGERGRAAASEAILESIRDAYEVNYQRDEQAVSGLRTELRLPFATRKITDFASRVPLSMKVRTSSDSLRKWILRDAAVKLGIPSEIALRPKKAIQHASGVEKAVREIAKDHHLSASTYLERRLQMVKSEFTG